MPHCNDAGLALICQFEGLRLRAYPDPGTGGIPWSIGYGDTVNVHPGEVITQAEALGFLRRDVGTAEASVVRAVTVALTPNRFAALVSFEYNTGALAGSTLAHCCNTADWNGAIAQFGRWIHAGGAVLPGLVTRRAAEAHLFAT